MRVTVVLLGGLESPLGTSRVQLDLSDGAKVKDAIKKLGIANVEYSSTILNDRRVPEDQPLTGGDVLFLFPPIAGG